VSRRESISEIRSHGGDAKRVVGRGGHVGPTSDPKGTGFGKVRMATRKRTHRFGTAKLIQKGYKQGKWKKKCFELTKKDILKFRQLARVGGFN